MILLDTDILTLYFAGHDKVARRVEQDADEVATTIVNRIEVLQGRFASLVKADDGQQLRQAAIRLDQAERDLGEFLIVPIDPGAVIEFDTLRARKKLRKIGIADLLIASVALSRKARLITRNLKDFEQVPGLQVENWAE